MKSLILFLFPGSHYDVTTVKFKTKSDQSVIIRRSFSIVNYYTRELLIGKNYCAIFLSSPRIAALKLVYFKVERGYPFMTYPGLISKLELKSPATVVLLDLS